MFWEKIMRVLVDAFEKALMDSWNNVVNLIVFNLFCALAMLPGAFGLSILAVEKSVVLAGITAVLFLFPGFFIFALFYIAADLNHDKPVKFARYFLYLRQTWRQALLWSGINVLIALIFMTNMAFYSQFLEVWSAVVQVVLLSLFVVWCILQLIMLAMYPRLPKAGFKMVLRNSMVIMGRFPLPVLMVVILTGIILGLTLFFQFLAFFFSFFAIAMLSSSMISVVFDGEHHSDEDSPSSGILQ
jgi:hypothetical protein